MYMDEVAADFPDLKIILAHPVLPWQEEALSVATHKPNVYIDLSGWSPKYFPPIMVRYINSILQDKMLFGLGLAGDHVLTAGWRTLPRSTSATRSGRRF